MVTLDKKVTKLENQLKEEKARNDAQQVQIDKMQKQIDLLSAKKK